MKVCPKCKIEKSLDSYYKRKEAGYKNQTYCKDCMKAYNKERWKKYKSKTSGWWI